MAMFLQSLPLLLPLVVVDDDPPPVPGSSASRENQETRFVETSQTKR